MKAWNRIMVLAGVSLLTFSGLNSASYVSALSYQKDIDVKFTFNPFLAVSLSSADLIIPNLNPGTSAYSNTISIGVDTNNIAGYTLSAKVGDGTIYTNDKLVNATAGTYFNNLTSSATLSNFNDNDWGYALGTVTSSTSYSGLTYNVDTVINATTNKAGTAASSGCVSSCSGTNATDFTIAAKASVTQAYGDYQNVIIFTVVSNIPPKTINDLTYMQDFKSLAASDKTSVLASMTEGTSYTLTDKRDNKTYAIAKLAGGRVWMRENLALDITALTQAELYGTGSDAGKMTNASNETLGYLKGASSRDVANEPNGNYPTAAVSKAWTSSAQNYYSVPMIAVDSTTSGPCDNAYCVDGGSAGSPWSYDSETSETINGVTSIVQGKIGVYYNYCAASAGSYCYGNGTSNTGSPSSDPDTTTLLDVTEDICPAGWRLPTSNSGGEFQALYTAYSSNVNNFQTALSTPLSGYFYSGKAYYQVYGYFWSSTWYDTYGMRNLYVDSSYVFPSDYNDRRSGFSVRCILGS